MSKKYKCNQSVGKPILTPKKRLISGKSVIFWLIFLVFIAISAWLRIGIQHEELTQNGLAFTDVDAYYHLMCADYTYTNYPNVQTWNDLLDWPSGQGVNQRPLWGFLIATVAKVGGFTVDQVGFYIPPVIFLLTLIPVLFIGWMLWNKWVGLIGACTLSVIQGEIFGRTSLGFCDQHVMEIFLACMIFMFCIMSIKKHWLWAFPAGLFLGLQYFNWAGAPIFALMLLVFVIWQSIIFRFSGQSIKNLTLIAFILFLVSFVMFVLFRGSETKYVLFYGCTVLVPILLQAIEKVALNFKPYWFVIGIGGVGVVSLGILYLVFGDTVTFAYKELLGLLGSVGSSQTSLGNTISEVQPILFPYGEFTFGVVWGCFAIVAITGVIGLIILCFKTESKQERLLFLIWSIAILVITMFQRRYGYYLAINLSLLSGFMFYYVINKVGWRKHTLKEIKKGQSDRYYHPVVLIVGVITIISTTIVPNFVISEKTAHTHPYALTKAWIEALDYLSENTSQEYGVISWWDYGYWIARESHRGVPCHPGGGNTDNVARFLISQTTAEANTIIDKLHCKYVLIDYQMAKHKFYAIPILAGKNDFTDAQYNDSMLARLYYSQGIDGYKLVFGSSTMYEDQPQIKIFEKQDKSQVCDCGK
ncbi:MAG: STT3 domain-containing protein [Patescibacteria group bacterium]|jgi:dolichyl-diphosphooligosaccharide--protein glycosyltransferase